MQEPTCPRLRLQDPTEATELGVLASTAIQDVKLASRNPPARGIPPESPCAPRMCCYAADTVLIQCTNSSWPARTHLPRCVPPTAHCAAALQVVPAQGAAHPGAQQLREVCHHEGPLLLGGMVLQLAHHRMLVLLLLLLVEVGLLVGCRDGHGLGCLLLPAQAGLAGRGQGAPEAVRHQPLLVLAGPMSCGSLLQLLQLLLLLLRGCCRMACQRNAHQRLQLLCAIRVLCPAGRQHSGSEQQSRVACVSQATARLLLKLHTQGSHQGAPKICNSSGDASNPQATNCCRFARTVALVLPSTLWWILQCCCAYEAATAAVMLAASPGTCMHRLRNPASSCCRLGMYETKAPAPVQSQSPTCWGSPPAARP